MEKLQEYKLETSVDGKVWEHRATFLEGVMSRFGEPFTAEVAVREAREYRAFWTRRRQSTLAAVMDYNDLKKFNHVRIIINI